MRLTEALSAGSNNMIKELVVRDLTLRNGGAANVESGYHRSKYHWKSQVRPITRSHAVRTTADPAGSVED